MDPLTRIEIPDPAMISREHRQKAARIAERLIDRLDTAVDTVIRQRGTLDGASVASIAAVILDLDAVSRGPLP